MGVMPRSTATPGTLFAWLGFDLPEQPPELVDLHDNGG
jgi:hypothetical protein